MATKLGLSFKNTTKEQKVFNYFNSLEDKGTEIKKVLIDWYEKNVEGKKEQQLPIKIDTKEDVEKEEVNILDF